MYGVCFTCVVNIEGIPLLHAEFSWQTVQAIIYRYITVGQHMSPQKVPLLVGRSGLQRIQDLLDPHESDLQRHQQFFAKLTVVYPTQKLTDRQTDRPCYVLNLRTEWRHCSLTVGLKLN